MQKEKEGWQAMKVSDLKVGHIYYSERYDAIVEVYESEKGTTQGDVK